MTTFTVTWWPDAEAELARLWLGSATPRALSQAADEIDRVLRTEPLLQGFEAGGHLRLLTVEPLAVLYSAIEEDRKVIVWSVRELPPR